MNRDAPGLYTGTVYTRLKINLRLGLVSHQLSSLLLPVESIRLPSDWQFFSLTALVFYQRYIMGGKHSCYRGFVQVDLSNVRVLFSLIITVIGGDVRLCK